MQKRLRIVASGRVQGVFFRASVKRVADEYGALGFARNLPDGKVEIVAEGDVPALRKLLDWCYRGSLLAHVDSLFFDWQECIDEFDKFDVELDAGGFVSDKIHALTNLGRRALDRVDKTVNENELAKKIPRHVAIIPDGNRRWARERALPVWKGHQEGIERTKDLIKAANKYGVNHMTFWGFSTENWSRPKEEVGWIMQALVRGVREFGKELLKNSTGFRHFGRKDRLSRQLNDEISKLERETAKFKNKKLALAIDYGGRDEITRAVKNVNGEITEEKLSAALDTGDFPDPDLIIRTSGEQRTSGMMPWQGVYSELYFSPLHYPDFTAKEFAYALDEYTARNRRFGSS